MLEKCQYEVCNVLQPYTYLVIVVAYKPLNPTTLFEKNKQIYCRITKCCQVFNFN